MGISSIQGSVASLPPLTTAGGAPLLSTYAPTGSGGQAGGVLSALTASDRSLIAAATGVVIAPDGSIVSGAGYVAAGSSASVEDFAFVIAAARQIGALQGPVTPRALASLFPPYITDGSPSLAATVASASSRLTAARAGGATPGGASGGPAPGGATPGGPAHGGASGGPATTFDARA